jgi:glycosyltransferase involved in cell wall biosynthesis
MENKSCRIALFFHDLGVGGAERVMLHLARGFVDRGFLVDLVLARAEGPLLVEVPSEARIFNLDTSNPLIMFTRFIKYLRAEMPNTLLSPFEVTSVIAILAKKFYGVPTRVFVRISNQLSKRKRTKWKKVIERWVVSRLYPSADGIVAVSRGVAEDLTSYAGISLERIRVIYNPVISEQLSQMAMEPVVHPFFTDDKLPVILGVGRLTEQKDFSTLIRAFDMVRRQIPSRLIILGDGEERTALEDLVVTLELQDAVDLPGFMLNPFVFMKKASVFVLSSKWEGLPGVLIQALACNCPVVSTDCPSGPSEILNDGQYGHLVPVGDVDLMAKAMKAALRGDTRKPPESWLEQYQLDVVTRQYEAVLCAD